MKTIDKVQKLAIEKGGELLAICNEKESNMMFQAIVKRGDEYVVWLYNAEFDGFYNGQYVNDIKTAIEIFTERINK